MDFSEFSLILNPGTTHWVIRDPKKRALESNPVPLDSESGDQPTGSSELKNTALKGFLCFKSTERLSALKIETLEFFCPQNRDTGVCWCCRVWGSPPVGVAGFGVHRQLVLPVLGFTASWCCRLQGSPPVGAVRGPGLPWKPGAPTNFPETAL